MLRSIHRVMVLGCAVLAGAAAVQGPAAVGPATAGAISIPFDTYTLPNGLTVIQSTDRTTPTVAVDVWYHVGSKNEQPGRTGFAHLFEHVMFTGSGHVPYGFHDKLTEGVGGSNNGTTSNDRTTYYETIPSNYLESALWLESDRMGFLLDSLDLWRLVFEDRVQVPRLYVQWPTVGVKNDDHFALDVLGAILEGRRTARLTKALVYDTQAAASVSAGQNTNEDVGEFSLAITPRPNHTLTDLEAAADAVLEKLKGQGPTPEEIQKATAGLELAFLRGLESNLGKAMQLADFHDDPGYFKTEYQKYLSVTAADVTRVAKQYLTKGRVVLSIVPVGKLDQASKPGESKKVTTRQVPDTIGAAVALEVGR